MDKNKNKKESICVLNAADAKVLVRLGFRITDLKPDRNDPDKKKTIFVFENSPGLYEKLRELKDSRS